MPPVDSSIYGNIRPMEMPSMMDSAQRAYTMADLANKNRLAQEAMETNQAVKALYSKHMGADGKLNQEGFLSDLGKISPASAMEYQKRFTDLGKENAEMQKTQSEAQKNQLEMAKSRMGAMGPALEYLKSLPEQDRAAAWAPVRQNLITRGLIGESDASPQYSPQEFDKSYGMYRQSKDSLELQKTGADIKKTGADTAHVNAETKMVPHQVAKLDAETAEILGRKNLTVGQKAADEAFGKEMADYSYGGGKATVEKNIARFQNAIDTMKKNPSLTGGMSTRVPFLNSDLAQDTLNPELAKVRDEIRGAVQGSLRQVLGAQFTEKEGEAIFNRAFNPRLPVEENIKRATAELEAIKRMAAQKDESAQAFLASGTLKGYSPPGTDQNVRTDVAAKAQMPGVSGGSDVINSANASSGKSGITAQDAAAIKWLKTADPSDPVAFGVRARLRREGKLK